MDKKFMIRAIELAKLASTFDEVPVGAVIVKDNKIIAEGFNQKETQNSATRHAEIEVIEKASKRLDNWYLSGCDLYVTLEPCHMCCGAIINSRIDNVYFGAYDVKAGCCTSNIKMLDGMFNHKANVVGGILEQECSALLTEFFKKKRLDKRNEKDENNCGTR